MLKCSSAGFILHLPRWKAALLSHLWNTPTVFSSVSHLGKCSDCLLVGLFIWLVETPYLVQMSFISNSGGQHCNSKAHLHIPNLLAMENCTSELCDPFWWNSFDSATAVFRSLKGKSVKANALSINSISSWISHLMESKMAQDLFAILTQWIWKGFHRACQAYWVQNGF